jgi:hypothetical protein
MTPTPVSISGTSSATAVVASTSKKPLSTGAIVGITIGGVVALILAAALIYMCGRQKTIRETLRHSRAPTQPGQNTYLATSPGMSEANHPTLQKTGLVAGDINDLRGSGRFGAQGYASGVPGTETESYRSMSLPIDERTGIMQHQMGNLMDPRYSNGQPSGVSSGHTGSLPNSPGYLSPRYTETHEMECGTGQRFVYFPPVLPFGGKTKQAELSGKTGMLTF